jgi:uncharacterized protein YraI
MKSKLLRAALSSIMLVGMAGAALAAPAVATANVNVRSGPGTDYYAVDTLRRGDRVDVEGCRAGWCYIENRWVEGWVSWRYLAELNRPSRPATVFQFDFGASPRWDPPRHRPGRDWDGPRRPDRDWDGPRRPDRDRDWDRGPNRGDRPDRDRPDRGDARPDRPREDNAPCRLGMPNWPNCDRS